MLERWAAAWGPDVSDKGEVDACVIGSGAGGAPVALTLARAGLRVVVLEKGPAYDQRDFINDEIGVARRNFFVPFVTDEPHVTMQQGKAILTNYGWTACCVGGGTVHMSGFTYRLHEEDFKLRSVLGEISGSTVADWPIDLHELIPYYEQAELELGISGLVGKNPFDKYRRPLPLPPLPENQMANLVDEACRKLGYHAYPTARAILSRAWQGRACCQPNTFCGSYGCAVGAKSSTLAALLPKAVATGNCQIRPLCRVHTIEENAHGVAEAVRYFDHQKIEKRLRAKIFIVACSPIETARLLLHSRSKTSPQGLANKNGWVGGNLMFLGFGRARAEFSRDDSRLANIDWKRPFIHRSVQDFYLLERDSRRPRKGGTIDFLLPHPAPINTAERVAFNNPTKPLWGKALKDALRHVAREVRELEFEVTSESLPLWESRVTLDPSVKDKWGLPVARYDHQRHSLDAQVNREIVEHGKEILAAMGGQNITVQNLADITPWVMSGTCRFGTSDKDSALDRDCRSYSTRNLFVTDGSFMPTCGGVPNTLTIEANAFRVADRILALSKSLSLS